MENIIDISWPITNNITEYKNKNSVQIKDEKIFEKNNVREKLISFNSHTGTHVDAPAHFLKNGKTLDQIDLNKLIGDCQVLDLTDTKEKITKEDLEKFNIKENEIILLKTKNSFLPTTGEFYSNFVYLEKSGAKYLAEKKIKSVGIDYLGIERNQPNHETHKILLENEILIIEGLRLKKANNKIYKFYCLPLNILNADSSPARAILSQ